MFIHDMNGYMLNSSILFSKKPLLSYNRSTSTLTFAHHDG